MRQLELTERMLHLRSVPTLRTVPTNDLAQLAASLKPRRFQKGECLLREDEAARSFFLIVSGNVGMRRHGHSIGTVRGPGSVGFMGFLARSPGGTSAIAESFVDAFEVSADAMEEIFEDHFTVLLLTMRFICERLIAENRERMPPPFTPPEVHFEHLVSDRELDIVERIFLVRRARAFLSANVNSLAALARRMQEVRHPPGEIWRPGAVSDHMVFVVKGMMELQWNEGTTVQSVGPGYVVGGAEAIVGLPRWNRFVALEPVVLLRTSQDALVDLFEDDFELALSFLSMMATFLMTAWDKKAMEGITSLGGAPSTPVLPEAGRRPAPFDESYPRVPDEEQP